jgi:hypothetical protein
MTFKDFEPAVYADAADSDPSKPSANWDDYSIICNADVSGRWRQGT